MKLEDLKNRTISEILGIFGEVNKQNSSNPPMKSTDTEIYKEFTSFQKAHFNCTQNWEDFVLYTCKNEKNIAPNIEDAYLKLLNEIIYKIEMSSIVYENVLSEMDDYEMKIILREKNPADLSIEQEIQNKKEKIKVMQENFLGNLRELAGKM